MHILSALKTQIGILQALYFHSDHFFPQILRKLIIWNMSLNTVIVGEPLPINTPVNKSLDLNKTIPKLYISFALVGNISMMGYTG